MASTITKRAQPDAGWKLVGGAPSLDFVNTVGARVDDRVQRDFLPGYDWLARWSAYAGVATAAERDRLREQARRSPAGAGAALRRGVALREAIFRIGQALAAGGAPPARDVSLLDREVREARRHQRLVARGGTLQSAWRSGPKRLDRILWPLALDAAELFGSARVRRLKQCGGSECGWLFLDTTRNHSRQWCDMGDCGNLAKVRRFRQRLRRK